MSKSGRITLRYRRDTLSSSTHLQVSDAKFVLVDVCSVGPCRQPRHGGQVSTVTPHGLNDEHPPLGASCRLLDPVTSLQGAGGGGGGGGGGEKRN